MEKVDGKSEDIVKENIEKLKDIFPDIVTEGNIDFDKLKTTLGDYVDDSEERYNFTWNGKAKAKCLAQAPSTGTLRPCKEESVNWDSTENLFIEGDNLEVLKLLQKTYHKGIKMIYIDPPYNTGKDFIYKDNFKDNIRNYLELTNQVDSEGKKMSTNPETSGRYHTDWLNMIYPRLKLARNLLKDDGIIFISIDDNEISNLRKICDDIFGEENFCGVIKRRAARKTAFLSKTMSDMCDYIVLYSKGVLSEVLSVEAVSDKTRPVFNEGNTICERIIKVGTECRCEDGAFKAGEYAARSLTFSLLSDLKIVDGKTANEVVVSGPWRVAQEMLNQTVYITRNFSFRRYVTEDEMEKAKAMSDLLDDSNMYNEKGTERLEKLFNCKGAFNNPKPVGLIKYLATAANLKKEDYVLDFFAGSCVVADAMLQNGHRSNFILIQLPEILYIENEEQKAGYSFCKENNLPKNIAEIGKERIRRVIDKIQKEDKEYKGDLGFKVFKLDSSNIKAWDSDFDKLEKSLLDSVDNIKKDRRPEDVLYEILLKYGLDLTLPIEERKICKKTVYSIGLGALIVCLDKDVSLDVVEGIAKLKEELNPEVARVVFSDAGFKDDVVKTNTIQILKQHGIEDVKSI